MSSQSAFTLLEALLVFSLMMITMAIGLPSLNHLRQASQDKLLISTMVNAIQFAKREALARHGAIGISPMQPNNWRQGMIIFSDANDNGVIENQEQQILQTIRSPFHGQLYWRSYPFYRHYLQFNPEANLENNGTFWHCHEKNATPLFALSVSKTGLVTIMYPNDKGMIIDEKGMPLTCAQ